MLWVVITGHFRGGSTCIEWVEARSAIEHLTTYRTVFPPKNYPGSSINCATVAKPWPRATDKWVGLDLRQNWSIEMSSPA